MKVIQVGCLALTYLTHMAHAQSVQPVHHNQSTQSVQSLLNQSSTYSGKNHLYKRMGKKSKQVSMKMNDKSHKTSQTSKIDDEMIFLDQQIRDNNIKSYYNESILDEDNRYLPTLHLASSFATGIFQGVNIEVENWLESKTFFSEYARLVNDINSCSSSLERFKEQDSVMYSLLKKASSTRAIWYIYTVGLNNLIRLNKPNSAYYEFVVNVFMDIDLTKIHEYIKSYVLRHQRTLLIRKSAVTKLTKSKWNESEETIYLFKVTNLMDKVLDVDILAPGFVETLAEIVNDSQEILSLDNESWGKHCLFDYAAELITKLQFIKLLLPLVTKNSKFIEKLNDMHNIKPKMNAYKEGEDTTLISQAVLDAFHGKMNPRFLTERYQQHGMYRHSKLNLNRTSVFGLRTYIQSYIEYYRNIMKNMLGSVNNTLFIPNAPQFRNLKETKISKKSGNSDGSSEEVEEWFDYKKMYESNNTLDHSEYEFSEVESSPSSAHSKTKTCDSNTLDIILNGKDLEKLEWSQVSNLIIAMGGYIESLGGSIKMLFVPGNFTFPIRFDRPSSDDKLGIEKASFLRRIFEKWGISSSGE